MKAYLKVLEKTSLFEAIVTSDLEHLISCLEAYPKQYDLNECIVQVGQEVNYISIVLVGQVEIVKENIVGNRTIIAVLEPTSLFGEGVVCTTKRISPVTVRAKSKTTVLLIPYEKIVVTCGKSCTYHSQLIKNMLRILGEKNMVLNQKVDFLILKGMREKIALYLLEQSKANESVAFSINLSRNDLADYLNVSRSAMSRELSRMKEENLIDYYKNNFKLMDYERLKDFVK